MSDYIGLMVTRSIVDQGLNQSDSVAVSVPKAKVLAAAVTVTASVQTVVIRGDHRIQFGLDEDRAKWVKFGAELGFIYTFLIDVVGLSPLDAALIVVAIGGYCVAHLSNE